MPSEFGKGGALIGSLSFGKKGDLFTAVATPLQITPTIVLRTLYRALVNGTDRMTTFGPNESNPRP